MLVESVAVRKFRSCRDAVLRLDSLTAVVGANGCGKSTMLRALELFYAPAPRFGVDDFYGGDTAKDIEVTVTFADLSAEEKTRFEKYVVGERLRVTRVLALKDGRPSHQYHGSRLEFAGFAAIRSASALPARKLYREVQATPAGADLPNCGSIEEVRAALAQWEADHPDQCERVRDDGQFFGFREVGHGTLARSTRLIFIPAVRDAADDAQDGKGSVIAEVMDLVVRKTVADRPDFVRLVEKTRSRYAHVFGAGRLGEVAALNDKLTTTLRTYVPQAAVAIDWDIPEVSIPLPRASVRLAEDGYATPVSKTGHGLQRAFVLTLLQHLSAAQQPTLATPNDGSGRPDGAATGQGADGEPIPDLLLVIEEPELFQHPSRQRHFAQVLRALAGRRVPGVTRRVQVLYCTHSPHFVGLDRFNNVRMFRKEAGASGLPKVTTVRQATLDQVASTVWQAEGSSGPQFTGTSMAARLDSLVTPVMSEGFFADVVVLVEGDGDCAAIAAAARQRDVALESEGYAIIPCGGKSKLLNTAAIFHAFGVPTFCVWDGDADKGESAGVCERCERRLDKGRADPKENHRLLRLCGAKPEDWPPLQVNSTFACFAHNLEHTLKQEIGSERFGQYLCAVGGEYGYTKHHHAVKNPAVLAEVLRRAGEDGRAVPTLAAIVDALLLLHPSAPARLAA